MLRVFPKRLLFALPIILCLELEAQVHQQDPIVGPLVEGKIYRKIDDYAITGKHLGDLIAEQLWAEKLGEFAERVLIQQLLEDQGIVVSDNEVNHEIARMAELLAPRLGANPKSLDPETLARHLGQPLDFLVEQYRQHLGLRKLLILREQISPDDPPESPKTKQITQEFIEALAQKTGIETDPEKLGKGEALNVGGRGFSRDQVRSYILKHLGPLNRSQIAGPLEMLSLTYLVREELKATLGRDRLERDDRTFHFSFRARDIEAEQGIPDGKQAILFGLKSKNPNMTLEDLLNERAFALDASFTALARQQIRELQIREEYERNPEKYKRREKLLAHIFIAVRDRNGRPYTLNWKVPGHPKVNALAEKEREEQFQKAEDKIRRAIGAAQANFAEAAAQFSEDEATKKNGGLVGRVSDKAILMPPFNDREFIAKALELKPGEISEPMRSAYGWHLVRCLDKQETTYEEAREQVYLMLLKHKRKEISERLQAILRDTRRVQDFF